MRFFVTLFIVALLVFLGVLLFNRSPSKPTTVNSKTLSDYAQTAADVRLTIDGIINGDDRHRQIRVTVDANERTIDIIGGYNGNVITTKSYSNNVNAYRVFLKALANNGFTRGRKTSVTDEEGVCPLGQRYIYELQNTGDSKTDLRTWNSSCGGGTFGGQGVLIRQLFANQISDYDQITNNVSL